jgi:hypothetical protein
MKTNLLLFLFFLISAGITAQVPQGFNYQAIARDNSGNPITGATINVKLSILSDTTNFFAAGTGTYVWEEQHNNVKTNAFGLFTIVLGNPTATKIQGSAGSFSAISWTPGPLYIGTKIYFNSAWKTLGSARLWTVPYAMVASSATKADGISSGSKLSVVSSDDATSLALFEVKRKDGQTVFAVYPDAVNIYVPAASKNGKGGFAIGGFGTAKAPSQDYFRVTRDSVRIYIPNTPTVKSGKGGFAIGGYDNAKGGLLKNYYMNVSGTSAVDTVKGSPQILWFPNKNAFLAGNVHIGAVDSVGLYSTALGYRSIAMGNYSQAFGYKAKAYGDYSTSIGKNSIAGVRVGTTSTASNAFAFGNGAKATGDNSYALGSGAIASGYMAFAFGSVGLDDAGNPTTTPTTASQSYTFALGMGAQATQKGGLALGIGALASGYYSNSLGYYSTSSGYYSTALGFRSTASNYYAGAFGYYANATGTGSLALGYGTNATQNYAVAVGASASASNTYASSFGRSASASGANAVAVGYGAIASNSDASSFGRLANAAGTSSVAIGYGANTTSAGAEASAFGKNASAQNTLAMALGVSATASGPTSTAIGYLAIASAQNALAFGNNNTSNGSYAVTLGNSNTAGANSNAVALGNSNVSSGTYSISLGNYNTSSNSYSTAIGYYSTASGDKSLAIGAKYVYNYIPKIIIIIPRFKGESSKGGVIDEDPNAIPPGVDISGKGLIPITNMNRINSADGLYSIAVGNGNLVTNGGAAYGVYNTASALYATAIGFQNTASATASFAGGSYNQSTGEYSTSFGRYTEAQSENSFAIGRYNYPTGNSTDWVDTDPIFQIGNGDATTAHDAFRVLKNGGTYIYADDAYYGLYVNNYAGTNTGSLYGVRSYVYNNSSSTGSLYSGYYTAYSYGTGNNYGFRSYVYGSGTGKVWSGYFYGGASTASNYLGFYADKVTSSPSDAAEYIYDTNGNTKPADVVIADPNKKESIIKSTKPYQSGILGVISTNPAITMGMEIVMDESTGEMKKDVKAAKLALAGRVPVNVCLENGPVLPGDNLTSSSIPGVAMKWTLLDVNAAKDFDDLKRILSENEKRRNAIIGKAVDSFSGPGTGKVIVLISVQ